MCFSLSSKFDFKTVKIEIIKKMAEIHKFKIVNCFVKKNHKNVFMISRRKTSITFIIVVAVII